MLDWIKRSRKEIAETQLVQYCQYVIIKTLCYKGNWGIILMVCTVKVSTVSLILSTLIINLCEDNCTMAGLE